MSRECKYNEITVAKLFDFVHRYSDRIGIKVVANGEEAMRDKVKTFYITKNLAQSQEETDRVLKYYGDMPVWNLHNEFADFLTPMSERIGGRCIAVMMVANCNWEDAREGYLREKEDIRKAKRKEYRERKKAEKND